MAQDDQVTYFFFTHTLIFTCVNQSLFFLFQVHWVEQQRILVRPKRDNAKSRYRYRNSMPDPIFKDMWYLVSFCFVYKFAFIFLYKHFFCIQCFQRKGALGGFDMNVESAWKMYVNC